MTVRLIRESDVREVVKMSDALAAVEASLLEQANGTGVNEPRRRVRQPHGTLHLMGAAVVERGFWGFKAYTVTRAGARFTINLYDIETGSLLALIEADHLGQLRTGAASGVATKHLARPDAGTLAVFGSGYQAETQLEAIAAVRSLRQVRVFSRSAERRASFAERMSLKLNLPVIPVESESEAIRGADIVTTITTANDPVFDGQTLEPGAHVNAAGANSIARAEIDATAVRRASLICTDDIEQARIESGALTRAFERNALNWSKVRRLADVVAGMIPGRQRADDITLFESHGIALWDIALAAEVFTRAAAAGLGTEVQFSF